MKKKKKSPVTLLHKINIINLLIYLFLVFSHMSDYIQILKNKTGLIQHIQFVSYFYILHILSWLSSSVIK